MEQDIKDKFTEIERRIEKTDNKVNRIEDRVYSVESNIKLINTNIDNLVKNTDEIKSDVKELKKLRDADHFVKPMEKSEKLRNQIFGAAIGLLVSGFLAWLFPMIR